MLMAVNDDNKAAFFETLEEMKSQLRRIEKLPVPVVAAINGAALGGGYEIALACNHRIALNLPSTVVGLPEVSLGLLPGGGGIVRMVNKLGLEKALPYLLEGKRLDVQSALDQSLVDEVVTSADDLLAAAKGYILQNKGSAEAAVQPWDREGFSIPGGNANSPKLAMLLAAAPAMLLAKTKGKYPAPKEILNVAVEAARLDFDTALRVESRALVYLAMTPQAKKMMADFFKK
jgi:3-hydroxyacyl-CoA dehydrogenase/enoyl-CoA hydratase/3-hydroxybutyryl-CoA epimerase